MRYLHFTLKYLNAKGIMEWTIFIPQAAEFLNLIGQKALIFFLFITAALEVGKSEVYTEAFDLIHHSLYNDS